MIRHLILAGSVAAAGFGGLVLVSSPATHNADVCVSAKVTVAGHQLVNQHQCESTTPPSLP